MSDRIKDDFEGLFDRKICWPRLFWANEADLRELCALSVEKFPEVEPLKTFTLVGATIFDLDLHWDNCPTKKSRPGYNDGIGYKEIALDTNRFRNFVFYLIRSGMPVAPDFEVHVSNLILGEDYLATDYQADVVMLCYIPGLAGQELANPPYKGLGDYHKSLGYKLFNAEDKEQKESIAAFNRAIATKDYCQAWMESKGGPSLGGVCSPLSSPENWAARLQQAEPKIIVSYHAKDTLPIHLARDSGMRHIVKLYSDYSKAVAAEIEQDGGGPISIEVAMAENFVSRAAAKLTDQTLLAMRIQHDHLGRHLPNLDGFGYGYFGNSDCWVPHAPYRIPDLDGVDARDYVDAFWSLKENPVNPEFNNDCIAWKITGEVRERILSHIDNYFPDHRRPLATKSEFSNPSLP